MKKQTKNFINSCRHKVLVASMAAFSTGLVTTIDIYQDAKSGDTTLMFMIDISGSMSRYNGNQSGGYACDLPTGVYENNYNGRGQATEAQFTGGPTYIRSWCNTNKGKYYDRITRVKDGMMDLLYGNSTKGITRLADDKIIGLSTLGAYTDSYYSAGAILVPARRLSDQVGSETQRQILIRTIGAINNWTNTPTAR